MDIKIAVASSDGLTVNQHFGKARQFRIYQLSGDNFAFLEERSADPACSGQQHSDSGLEQTAELIADCQAAVVSQIGASAIDVLIARRIVPFSLEGSIDEALAILKNSNRLKFLRK
jgi:predicted Fe-Mo cluster-binding NifX family protein